MFQPKKTIPKLLLGTLALSGCGDPAVPETGNQNPCLTQKVGATYGLYDEGYGDYAYGDPIAAGDFVSPSYADGCGNGDGGYERYGEGGGGDGVVLPDNDPNPTNDSFLPGGDSFYNGY